VKIGAADSHPPDFDTDLAAPSGRPFDPADLQFSGVGACNGFHQGHLGGGSAGLGVLWERRL
ncbi:MAG: hypothetical protein RIC82_07320, partial [Parvibaculum sp.]